MLGGLLSRQEAEEENRQRQQQQQAVPVALSPVVPASLAFSDSFADSHDGIEFGSSHAVGEDLSELRYDEAEYGENDEGEYSYTDDDDLDQDPYGDGSDADDDDGCSSTSDDGERDERHEASYLLAAPQRRRRRRRREISEERKNDGSFRRWRRWCRRAARRVGGRVRAAAVTLADVDNMWDSPDHHHYHPHHHRCRREEENPGRNLLYSVITGGVAAAAPPRRRAPLVFWFLFLSCSYALERSSFKLLVDNLMPFRLLAAELVLGAHALLVGLGMLAGWALRRRKSGNKSFEAMPVAQGASFGLGLPLVDVGCELPSPLLLLLGFSSQVLCCLLSGF